MNTPCATLTSSKTEWQLQDEEEELFVRMNRASGQIEGKFPATCKSPAMGDFFYDTKIHH
jgi:hypothetical protein